MNARPIASRLVELAAVLLVSGSPACKREEQRVPVDQEVVPPPIPDLGAPQAPPPQTDAALQLVASGDDAKRAAKTAAELREGGQHDEALVAALVQRLRARAEPWTVAELTRLGPRAKAATPELTALLQDEDTEPKLRARLADALWNTGGPTAAVAAFDGIKDATTQETLLSTISAGFRQGRGTQEDADVVLPTVTAAMAKPKLRMRAIIVLREMGPRAVAAVPAMARLLQAADGDTRAQLAYALVEIGASGAEDALLSRLGDEDEQTRLATARGLGCIRTDAIIERLKTAVSEGTPSARATAARALWYQGQRGKPALDALIEALAVEDDDLRLAAAEAIGPFGPDAAQGVPALRAAAAATSSPEQGKVFELAIALIEKRAEPNPPPPCPTD